MRPAEWHLFALVFLSLGSCQGLFISRPEERRRTPKSFGKSALLLLPNSAPGIRKPSLRKSIRAAGFGVYTRMLDSGAGTRILGLEKESSTERRTAAWTSEPGGERLSARERIGADGTTENEMPTPIGHIASGLLLFAVGCRPWRKQASLLLAQLFFALLPDIDLAFGLLLAGNANAFHHQATHSILFVAAAGWIGGRLLGNKGRYTPLLIAAGLIHLALDLLAKDTSVPYGAQVLWPFWNGYIIAPVQIFSDVHRSGDAASFLPSLFNGHNLQTIGIELAVFGLLWGLWFAWSSLRRRYERKVAS